MPSEGVYTPYMHFAWLDLTVSIALAMRTTLGLLPVSPRWKQSRLAHQTKGTRTHFLRLQESEVWDRMG